MEILKKEAPFLLFFVALTAGIGYIFQRPDIAMWTGFILAAYSAIGNDSIQTLGTFLTSNEKIKWWVLWMFIGGIFIVVMTYGWHANQGDVAFGRLNKIQYTNTFSFFQIFAPAVLLLLTRYRIPVSTTFLLLSVFSTAKTVEKMIVKSLFGYALAFICAFLFWGALSKFFGAYFAKPLSQSQQKRWRILQWASTAFLWSSWLMQDTSNIAVFFPRIISWENFLIMTSIGFLLIGFLLFIKGGRIQSIVREKKDVVEVRAATLIDIMLAFILLYFKKINDIPMSTTWVFLGLLAGREIILSHFAGSKGPFKESVYLVAKDIMLAALGLVISVILVICTRPDVFLPWVKGIFLIGN